MRRAGWRITAESTRRIDLARMKEWGLIPKIDGPVYGNMSWTCADGTTDRIHIHVNTGATEPHVRFVYRVRDLQKTYKDDWVERDYKFYLEKISCRYGGHKWFFRCGLKRNGVYCDRRARVLFCVGGYYGCRHCTDITYESCNRGGRYKGFLSVADLERQEEKIGRRYYAGKPTRKYRRFLKMEEQFACSLAVNIDWLRSGFTRK